MTNYRKNWPSEVSYLRRTATDLKLIMTFVSKKNADAIEKVVTRLLERAIQIEGTVTKHD